MNDGAGLSNLGLPTGLGGAGGGLAAMAAASNPLTLSNSLSQGGVLSDTKLPRPSPSERLHFVQPTKSVLCPFGAWGSRWGARAGQWLKYHTLRALKKSNLFYSCELRGGAGIN